MARLAIALPCLPGGGDRLRQLAEQIRGPRKEEFEDFHRRAGLESEGWYLQKLGGDEVFILTLEGDLPAALDRIAASDHPFDRWFTEQARSVHGIDFNQPGAGAPSEKIFEG